MFDLIPQPVKNMIDTLFNPPLTFLNMIIEYLDDLQLIAGKGINLNNFFGFFAYLPPAMQTVVNSIIASIIFLAILHLVRAIVRMFFTVKDALFRWL